MTFRIRLLLIFTVAVVAAVGVVEWKVLDKTRQAFEDLEAQRVGALVRQFGNEYDRRKQEIVLAVKRIAASQQASDIARASLLKASTPLAAGKDSRAASDIAGASSPEPVGYLVAVDIASSNGLGLLELVAADGTIVSSAEWPERFDYKEEWLTSDTDWKALGAFLKPEELRDGFTLSLLAVGTATAEDRKLYVVGGQQLDKEFLSALAPPEGMRVLLYRNLDPQFSPSRLIQVSGTGPRSSQMQVLIERVLRQKREVIQTLGQGEEAETFHALPLTGYEDNVLGVLLIGSSRGKLVRLEASFRRVGILVAAGGILLGIALSWWATARVTRPVLRLAESAAKVAAGNWGATVDTASNDEIGQLARAFNRMTHELVEQRDRLVQAERVAAWRELARRLAHELKNPLFPLQITVENMQRARESYPEQFDEVFRESTGTLLAELANLKQIIGRFSDFAKMPAPEMQAVDLNELAAGTLKLFEPQLAKSRVQADAQLDPQLRPVHADPEQMARVLRNLVLNAIDAMPEGGTLTVRTVALAGGARLEVSDTGQGLTPEECERLFTPYYTTKTHGTGLGLAIVQSVVSDHKGRIAVESSPGKGSTFRIEL
ncbi:MAG TPA: ATP-binding protein [Bryobacteraceae bacterium]|nr:ATP-binding protein [Bryobacteraceae bacterium]